MQAGLLCYSGGNGGGVMRSGRARVVSDFTRTGG